MTFNPLLALAEVAASWGTRTLGAEVAWATRRATLDWFATTLPGCRETPAVLLARALSPGRGSGDAQCYVTGASGTARWAALLNGTASHAVEFDDIFKDGGYHPGSPTIAAALALAQEQGASLERFQRAVIAGYEVGCRVSLAIQPSHYTYWHTTATVGTIGAATAAAVILGAEALEIAHAVALATSFAAGHQGNLRGTGMAKAMHPGHAAEAGILAALAAHQGMTGSLDSLHGPTGYAAATSASSGDWNAALAGLGQWTPITRMTVKNHGCCGHIFPALDGLTLLIGDLGLTSERIAALHVEGYGATKNLCDRPDPQSASDARFSLQYCLAARLLLGAVRLEAFRAEVLGRADIRAVMGRITLSEAPDLAAAYPQRRMARLTLRLDDGREVALFQRTRKGDPEDPLSDAELIGKFEELASDVLLPEGVEALKTCCLQGDRLPGAIPPEVWRPARP